MLSTLLFSVGWPWQPLPGSLQLEVLGSRLLALVSWGSVVGMLAPTSSYNGAC